jgi:two-component system, NtrC family, sensor histidine kinase GlrK
LKFTYPNSFLKVLLIGFALAILPLLAAFISANIYFDALTKQSLFNMSQAVETTRASRILLEELAVMERSARQYFVLHDELLLTNYLNAHDRLNKALTTLSRLPITQPLKPELEKFSNQENDLFISIRNSNVNISFDQNMIDSFTSLANQAYKITNLNNQLIDKESALFKTKVTKTQRLLFLQALALVPLAVVIAGLITWMIARPIRSIDAAIGQLGKGDYEHVIDINGPGDLRLLGSRLNWLRSELKNLHQQKQRFMQQASHELKTPLTAIREASELLNDGIAGKLNTQQTEITRILRENSLRLQAMIENLLKYIEAEFYASKLKSTELSLTHFIDEIFKHYALSIEQKNIKINQIVDDVSLIIDAEKLRAVLDNLISNAVKFTPNMGEITLQAKHTKSILTIDIKDTGAGIKEADKASLFEPFYRGEQPNNSLVNGSGLGLFIAKEAVIALHGEISLQHAAVGAHFVLRLPTSQAGTLTGA